MRMLLVVTLLLVPACGGSSGGNTPTPVTQPAAPAATPAPTAPPATVAAIAGSWDSDARRWHFRLEQRGTVLSGQLLGYRNVYYPNPASESVLALHGTVSSTGAVSFGCASDGVFFEGRVDSASRMTGTLYDCVNGCRSYGDTMVKTAN
jgi:hypothetical protein